MFPVTLAVLPFDNLGNDPESEYLADGLTEETTASLGVIDPDHLSVKGRTSTMRYKRTTKSLAEIGRELAADYLVESTVQMEGERLRVTSKLIRVRDQSQVWSQSYDRERTSMLALQRDLSLAIAEQIGRRLSPERLSALTRRQPQNGEAYVLYLKGEGPHEPGDARNECARDSILRTGDCPGSDVRARVVRAGVDVCRQHHER